MLQWLLIWLGMGSNPSSSGSLCWIQGLAGAWKEGRKAGRAWGGQRNPQERLPQPAPPTEGCGGVLHGSPPHAEHSSSLPDFVCL